MIAPARSTWRCCGQPVVSVVAHTCNGKRAASPPSATGRVKRDGSQHEEALFRQLVDAGYFDIDSMASWSREVEPGDVDRMFLAPYPWGAQLRPRRGFLADFGFPASRLLVEVDGISHKIGHRQRGDVLKRQLADAAGYKVLAVLPEQVHDNSAIQLIRASLDAARGAT